MLDPKYESSMLYFFFCNQPSKMLERSVPGLFRILRKTAAGKLPAIKVIADTFTANTFPRAGLVAAITGFEVFFFLTLHWATPFNTTI